MGRYVTPSTMRNQRMVLTDSNPALPVPSWAKVAKISGCGGGAGGANVLTAGKCGGGGGAGGAADGVLLPLTANSVAITIGAGGAGSSGGATGVGNLPSHGGTTSISCGGQTITLDGGKPNTTGGVDASSGGDARFGSGLNGASAVIYPPSGNGPLRAGAGGSDGDVSLQKGCGGHSLFGAGGSGINVVPADRAGPAGTGYGSGGAGGNGAGGGGAGKAGIVIIEFLESL